METFPISELVRRVEIPRSTVSHYLRLGVLPPARKVSPNRFLYDERHVRALKLIRLLRERRGLPLHDIRRIVPDLLALDNSDAFHSDMWDLAELRLRSSGKRSARDRLVSAALKAFGAKGYAAVRVDDICEAAGVGKGSFYRYFASKDDILFAAVEQAAKSALEPFRDREPASLTEEQAVGLLAASMKSSLPLFLELVAAGLRKRSAHRAVAAQIVSSISAAVGRTVDPSTAVEIGERIVGKACAAVYNGAVAGRSKSPLSEEA